MAPDHLFLQSRYQLRVSGDISFFVFFAQKKRGPSDFVHIGSNKKAQKCASLGHRQGVRHSTLTAAFAGSNPAGSVMNIMRGIKLRIVGGSQGNVCSGKPRF